MGKQGLLGSVEMVCPAALLLINVTTTDLLGSVEVVCPVALLLINVTTTFPNPTTFSSFRRIGRAADRHSRDIMSRGRARALETPRNTRTFRIIKS